jgi:hypothetical protein
MVLFRGNADKILIGNVGSKDQARLDGELRTRYVGVSTFCCRRSKLVFGCGSGCVVSLLAQENKDKTASERQA